MRARRFGAALAVCIAMLCAMGCGYRLAGGNIFLPEHIKVIAVLPFENRTQRPEIEQRVTEEVARELTRRGRYRIVTVATSADAVLEGAITAYSTTPVQFTSTGRATRVEAVVRIQSTLRDTAADELLWSQTGMIFREQFDVPETGEFFDQETLALDDIAAGAADVYLLRFRERSYLRSASTLSDTVAILRL